MRTNTKTLIFGLILIILSGAARGTRDAVEFHTATFYDKMGIEESGFWGKTSDTWRNKYKEGSTTKPRFLFSTTLLVPFTDSWHFMSMVDRFFLFVSFAFLLSVFQDIFRNLYKVKHIFFLKRNAKAKIISASIVIWWLFNGIGFAISYNLLG